MATGNEKQKDDRPLGQVLMEQLAVAMVDNNNLLREQIEETKLLREQLEMGMEVTSDVGNQLAGAFRILSYLTDIGKGRKINWGDVADVIGDIVTDQEQEDEVAAAEDAAELAAEKGEDEPDAGGGEEAQPPSPTPVPVPEEVEPATSPPQVVPIPVANKKTPQEIFTKPPSQ